MKIGVGTRRPDAFTPSYPEEFDLFSHLELCAAVPQALFAVTTWKANGLPNVCAHAWSSFHGDRGGFFAVMGCLYKHTHTYANILREGCFCLNFLSLAHYDGLMATIRENDLDADEFCVGGFDLEQGKRVRAPAIEQSFMNMECSLHDVRDLSGANVTAMVIGRVEYVAVEERYALEAERRFGREGFMLLAPGPQNLATGAPTPTLIGRMQVERRD